MSVSSPVIVLGPLGSSLPFCDVDCYQVFTFYQDHVDQVGAKKLSRSPHNCFHCAGCGRLVYGADSCLMHENECPGWVWYSSYPTTADFVDTFIAMRGPIPKIAFDLADLIAEHNQFISGTELAQLTIDRLDPG